MCSAIVVGRWSVCAWLNKEQVVSRWWNLAEGSGILIYLQRCGSQVKKHMKKTFQLMKLKEHLNSVLLKKKKKSSTLLPPMVIQSVERP